MKTGGISLPYKDAKTSGLTLLRADSARGSGGSEKGTILVVDPSLARRRSIAAALDPCGHHILETRTATEAFSVLAERSVDVAIVDYFVPELGAVDFCRKVRPDEPSQALPVVVLSRTRDIDSEVLALEAGADQVLAAPVRPRALRARVEAVLRRRALFNSLDETETVLFALAQLVEEKDPCLGKHCERLALMAAAVGIRLGLPPADIIALQRGGYLHDIGKVAVPDNVLLKPGPLTPEEWVVMKSHVEKGARICSKIRTLAPVVPIIRHHHEKWDGSGYPDGLKGEEIPLLARIMQVVDIYDALIAIRPYKRAFTPEEAIEMLREEVAKGWRDPKIVRVFQEVLPAFLQSEEEESSVSLAALAESVETYRKVPGAAAARGAVTETEDVRMVSGL